MGIPMLMVVNGFTATSLYSSPVCSSIPARSSVNIAMQDFKKCNSI